MKSQHWWSPLWRGLGGSYRALWCWGAGASLLGLSSASLAFCVGPLLRVIFGGGSLSWSPLMTTIVGAPPSLDSVKTALPWVISGVAVVKAGSFYIERVMRGAIARELGRYLRGHVLRWSLELDEDARISLGQDELRARLTVDVERVERWLEGSGAALLRDGLQVILLGVSAIVVSGWAGALILGVYPLLISPIIWASRRLKRAARRELSSAHLLGRWAAYTEAHLSRAQAARRGEALCSSLDHQHHRLERDQARLAHLQGLAPSFTELSVSLVIAVSLAGFTWGLERSWWSAEELMSLFVCVLMLYAPVKSLGRAQQQWVSGRAALERVSASLIELESDRLQPQMISLGGPAQHLTPCLSLTQVTPLRGGTPRGAPISLEMSGGELIAIVGDNGSGKSSLLLGLAGLVPILGEIYWGDRSGRYDYERADHDQRQSQRGDPRRYLLEGVSWGGQPARLLTDDVDLLMNTREGIDTERELILKQLSIDMTSLRAPRREADIDPEELTLRYWDWFQGLSSGERQRLQLATLLAQPTRLLLLDEPEAHLDEAGVRALISLLCDRDESRIVIIATHSDSLRDACDRIVDLSALSR